ncbi:glycosyltransferase [Candidatus Bipolaricaulota bacterium]
MRVLQLVTSSSLGGTEVHVARLAGCAGRGLECEVCILSGPGPLSDLLAQEGVEFRHLPIDSALSLVLSATRLYRFLRRRRFDVVHAYGFRANILARVVGRSARVGCVVGGLRSMTPSGSTSRMVSWLDRLTFGLTAGYVSNSQAAIDALVARGYPRNRFWLIRNGIDLPGLKHIVEEGKAALRVKHGLPAQGATVISIANLRPPKDHATLLDAMSELRTRSVTPELLLVGDGLFREELEQQTRELGLEGNVRFFGRVDNRVVLELAVASDIAVLCSHVEGLPTSLIEAMAVGLPVVATDVGGVSEVVADGETGVLVPPGDPRALAQAIQDLIGDEVRRAAMSEAAQARVEERFSLSRTVEEHEDLYRELAGIDNGTTTGTGRRHG